MLKIIAGSTLSMTAAIVVGAGYGIWANGARAAGEGSGSDAMGTVEHLWEVTKDSSYDAWDATKQGSHKAWEATKEGSQEAWDATKEGSHKAWEATKEGSNNAWDKTREFTDEAFSSAQDAAGDSKEGMSGADDP